MATVFIPCGSKKRQGYWPARDLYTGGLFRMILRYCQTCHRDDDVFILSAKHGLLPLDKVIESYDETLNRFSKEEKVQWRSRVKRQIREAKLRRPFISYCGASYRLPIKNVEYPMKGLGIGYQMKWCNDRIKSSRGFGFCDNN